MTNLEIKLKEKIAEYEKSENKNLISSDIEFIFNIHDFLEIGGTLEQYKDSLNSNTYNKYKRKFNHPKKIFEELFEELYKEEIDKNDEIGGFKDIKTKPENLSELTDKLLRSKKDIEIEQVLRDCDYIKHTGKHKNYTTEDMPNDFILNFFSKIVNHEDYYNTIPRLEIALKASTSADEAEKILSVCDAINNDMPPPCFIEKNYTINDLPTQRIYDKYAKYINHKNRFISPERMKALMPIIKYTVEEKPFNNLANFIGYPNINGIELTIKFSKIDDKLKPVIAHTKNKIVTDKIQKFISHIEVMDKNTNLISNLKDITEIIVHGIFTHKNKFIDDNGNEDVNHKMIALNKLFEPLDKFEKDIDYFEFVGLEIGSISKNQKTIKTITQKKNFIIMQNINCFYVHSKNKPLCDIEYFDISNFKIYDFNEKYNEIIENEQRPTNGIIYCHKNWKLHGPVLEQSETESIDSVEKTDDENINNDENEKYIWLHDEKCHVKIIDIVEKIGDGGALNFYAKAKNININSSSEEIKILIPINSISDLKKNKFGIGAVCSIETKNEINFLYEILIPGYKPFDLPKYCKNCSKELKIIKQGDKIKFIKCVNIQCKYNRVELWFNFIKKVKNYYKDEKIILYKNIDDSGNIEKGLKGLFKIETLRKINETDKLNRNVIELIAPGIFDAFNSLSLSEQLVSLGYAETLPKAKKLIEEKGYENLADVGNIWINN